MTSLIDVDLSDNALSGTISSRLGLLTRLSTLDVADNHLAGRIPREVSLLTDLSKLGLNGNPNLGGSIPEKFCSNRHQGWKVLADCAPTESTGMPAVVCPDGCCSTCCDAETKICSENRRSLEEIQVWDLARRNNWGQKPFACDLE